MKTFILMSMALATIAFLTHLFSGKMKSKPPVPANLWLFYLIEKIFGENELRAKEVKENGMPQANPGQNKDV
ncbi:MAG TPA: hypothetical protein VGB16_00890 [candidate division Zixibacteria bacterium]